MNIKNGTRIWFMHRSGPPATYYHWVVVNKGISAALKKVKTHDELLEVDYRIAHSNRLFCTPPCGPYASFDELAKFVAWACGMQTRNVTKEYFEPTRPRDPSEDQFDQFFGNAFYEFFLPEENSH